MPVATGHLARLQVVAILTHNGKPILLPNDRLVGQCWDGGWWLPLTGLESADEMELRVYINQPFDLKLSMFPEKQKQKDKCLEND